MILFKTAINSNFCFYSSTVLLMQSIMTPQLINQVIFHWHIIHKVWPFALLATNLTTLWELAWHLHQPPSEYLPGWLCNKSAMEVSSVARKSLFILLKAYQTNRNCKNECTAGQVDWITKKWAIKDYLFHPFSQLDKRTTIDICSGCPTAKWAWNSQADNRWSFSQPRLGNWHWIFNPRPLRPKGYCRHLHLSVCLFVCLSVCPIIFVNTITQSVYPISPPNLLGGFNMAISWMVL